jgi:hypothetical protein
MARTGIEAYNRGDVDAVFELATDDVEFVVPDSMANSGTYVGREGFESMMRQWEEAWEEFRVEIVELIQEGDAGVVSVSQAPVLVASVPVLGGGSAASSRFVKFRVGKSAPRCDTRLEWTRWLAPSSRGSITRIRRT